MENEESKLTAAELKEERLKSEPTEVSESSAESERSGDER